MRRITVLIFILSAIRVFTVLSQGPDWSNFRGKPDLTGRTGWNLPDKPELLWTYNAGVRTKSSPVISEGVIYFGTEKGSLIACEPDGKLKWKTDSGSSLDAPPMITGNIVIYSSSDGVLRSSDKRTGKISWIYRTENQIAGSANLWNAGGKTGVIVGSYDFFLHCVDPLTGRPVWRLETENYINGTPAYSSNQIVFGGCDGVVRIVDPLSGKQKDTLNIGVYIASSVALMGSYAFFGDYEGNFYCLNIPAGKVQWKKNAGNEGSSIYGVPAVGSNSVIIGSDDKYLYSFDTANGSIKWKFRTNGGIRGSAVIAGDRVLFGSDDGYVYVLGLNDGSKKWSFNCGGPVSSSPAVIKDRFYILTEDGRLLAFGNK